MKSQTLIFTTITFLLLVQSPFPHSQANKLNKTTESNCPNSPKHNLQTLTKDIISLAIKEIQRSRNFIKDIPRLRSLKQHATEPIMNCITGLSECLTDVNKVLHRTRSLRRGRLEWSAKSLNGSAVQVLGFSRTCHLARRDLDDVIVVMIDRKLVDVSILVNDVVRLIDLLQQ